MPINFVITIVVVLVIVVFVGIVQAVKLSKNLKRIELLKEDKRQLDKDFNLMWNRAIDAEIKLACLEREQRHLEYIQKQEQQAQLKTKLKQKNGKLKINLRDKNNG